MPTTVLTVTQTIHWSVAESNYNQRNNTVFTKHRKTSHINIGLTTSHVKRKEYNIVAQRKEVAADKGSTCQTPEESWTHLKTSINIEAAFSTFGRKSTPPNDWFDLNADSMLPAIDTKRAAHLRFKNKSTRKSLQDLRAARSAVQRTAGRCAYNFWLQNSVRVFRQHQTPVTVRGMYDYEGITKPLAHASRKLRHWNPGQDPS